MWFKILKKDSDAMIFSNEVKLNMNTRKTRKNNVLVIGSSGVGRGSIHITTPYGEFHFYDPKRGVAYKTLRFLEGNSINIKEEKVYFDMMTDIQNGASYEEIWVKYLQNYAN